jgi:hypothetical protein
MQVGTMDRAQLIAAKRAARYSRIGHLLHNNCPYCHAPAGEPCRSKSGTPIWEIGQIHDSRLTAPRVNRRYHQFTLPDRP